MVDFFFAVSKILLEKNRKIVPIIDRASFNKPGISSIFINDVLIINYLKEFQHCMKQLKG